MTLKNVYWLFLKPGMINMIELFNYHQVTIDVASPEAGTIQKVIFMNYSNIKLVKSDNFVSSVHSYQWIRAAVLIPPFYFIFNC